MNWPIHHVVVYLQLSGAHLSPDMISEALGRRPDVTDLPGQHTHEGFWMVKETGKDANSLILKLIADGNKVDSSLLELSHEYRIDILVDLHFERETSAPSGVQYTTISPYVLDLIRQLGATLGLTLSNPGDFRFFESGW